jgi:hypothetical protein
VNDNISQFDEIMNLSRYKLGGLILNEIQMSLVIAKKDGSKIYVVSDTKLTNPNNLNRIKLEAPEEFGAIKTVIINPFISISFAGDVSNAKKAIAVCRKLDYKINDIINHLLETNIQSGNTTEFIVCISLPPFHIVEIKDSKFRSTVSAWIGNIEGFNEFQRNYVSSNKSDLQTKMDDSLTAVIESNVQGINGFLIGVTNEGQQFSYKQYVKSYGPSRTYTGSGTHFLDVYGTVQEGCYTVHIYSNEQSDVLAVHVRQNRYGLIYSNKDDGYLEPDVYKDVDEHEFNEITEAKHGMRPMGIISSAQKSYFERGNKAGAKREFEKAIEFYDLGLRVNENSLIGHLYFSKGVCQFYLRRFNEATQSFNEAVKIDKSFQPKVFNFISQLRRK